MFYEFLTFNDVFPVDFYMLVAVAPSVLVVETQSMQELMLDDGVLYAAKPLQHHHLFVTNIAHHRLAAKKANTM